MPELIDTPRARRALCASLLAYPVSVIALTAPEIAAYNNGKSVV